MTTPTQPTAPDALGTEQTDTEACVDSSAKPVIPAFSFPFKPSDFAKAKAAAQPYYQKGGTGHHHKTPDAPPHGTRKTMGKR